jgi:hypothetical protein
MQIKPQQLLGFMAYRFIIVVDNKKGSIFESKLADSAGGQLSLDSLSGPLIRGCYQTPPHAERMPPMKS